MTAAPPYNRQYNFTNYQALSPNLPLPATPLDIEFNAVKITTDAIEANLALIQRSDGALANATVGPAQLSPSLALGVTNRGIFAAGTVYNASDAVFEAGVFYICILGYKATATLPGADPTHWSVGADFNASIIQSAVDAASTASVYRTYPTRTTFAASTINGTITSAVMLGYASPGDCEPHTYLKLGAAPSPAKAWHVQTADGAWWVLATRRIDIRLFGASTAAADNTTAINNAIAFASIGGGAVLIPAGTWNVLGTLTISIGQVGLVGDGQEGSVVKFGASTADCIVLGAASTQCKGAYVKNLSIDASLRTGGRAIFISNCHFPIVQDVFFAGVWNGIEIYLNNNNADLQRVIFQVVNNGAGGFAIYWHDLADGTSKSDVLNIDNVVINASYKGADGLVLDGEVSTANINVLTCLHCYRGIWIKNSAAATHNCPFFVQAFNYVSDGIIYRSLQIDGGREFYFTNCWLENTSTPGAAAPPLGQGGADDCAVFIAADTGVSVTADISFVQCKLGNSLLQACVCSARNVSFVGCDFVPGGKTGANTVDALEITASAQDIMVTSCSFLSFGDPINWRYCVNVAAGAIRILLAGGNYNGGVTGPIQWSALDQGSYVLPGLVSANLTSLPGKEGVASMTVTGSFTATAAQILSGLFFLGGAAGGAVFTIATPTASELIAATPFPFFFKTQKLTIMNTTAHDATLAVGSIATTGCDTFGNNSSAGNYLIPAGTTRELTLIFKDTAPGAEYVTFCG